MVAARTHRVVRRRDGEVETKGRALHDAHEVTHDGHLVQRGLAIEQHRISVEQMAFDDVALAQSGDRPTHLLSYKLQVTS